MEGLCRVAPPKRRKYAQVAITSCAECGEELVIAQIVCQGHSCKAAWHRDDAGNLSRVPVHERSA